ncbi:MAG: potassium channel family protein [Nitrososphaeria archaeon]
MQETNLASILAQLKDLSEMMVDLAYSAFICGSEEIAKQVLMMEDVVDTLHIEFELEVLHSKDKFSPEEVLGSIRLAMAAEELADAATRMAMLVKKGVRAHPVVKMAFQEADEMIAQVCLSEDSALCNKSIGELGLEDDLGIRVVAVKRGEKWFYNPSDSFQFLCNDIIIFRGYAEGASKFLKIASHKHEEE